MPKYNNMKKWRKIVCVDYNISYNTEQFFSKFFSFSSQTKKIIYLLHSNT